MLFDLSIAIQLLHDLFKVVAPTPRSGACETWVPLGPHRPCSRPSPTSGSGLPEDPPTCQVSPTNLVGGPHDLLKTFQKIPQIGDLIQNDHKTRYKIRHRWISTKQTDGYGKYCNLDLGLQVVSDQESGNQPHPLANIRRARRTLYYCVILKQSTPTTEHRVLLS
jgi:hypothetical protein